MTGDGGLVGAAGDQRDGGLARVAWCAILCVALAMHAGLFWLGHAPVPRTLKGDELVYWPAAQALAAGEVVTEAEYSSLWPRGYLWFLAGWIVGFGAERWVVEGVQTLLLFLAAWMIRDLGRRWTGSTLAGDVAGSLTLLYPPLAAFAHYFWPEALHLFLFVTALWLLTRDGGKRGRLVAAGAGLALAVLTKSLLLPFLPLLLFVVMRTAEEPAGHEGNRAFGLKWGRAAWVVLGLALVLIPVRVLTSGASSAQSAATFNLWLGWNDHGPTGEVGRIAYRGYTEYMAGGATQAERDRVLRSRLVDQLRDGDLFEMARTQLTKQSRRFLNRETFLDSLLKGKSIHPAAAGYADPPDWLAATLVGTSYFFYSVLLLGGVWGVALASSRRGSWLWMAGLFLAYNLALFFFLHVKTRYRIQCLPFLFIFTGWTVAWLAVRLAARKPPTVDASSSRVRAVTGAFMSLLVLYLAFGDLLFASV